MLISKMFRKPTNHHHCAKNIRFTSLLILAVCLWLFCLVHPARAEVSWSGDVSPDDPTMWSYDTDTYIGNIGLGTLNIASQYETATGPRVATASSNYITGDSSYDSIDFNIGGDDLVVPVGAGSLTLEQTADAINVRSRGVQAGWNAATVEGNAANGYQLVVRAKNAGAVAAIAVTNVGATVWANGVSDVGGNAISAGSTDFLNEDGSITEFNSSSLYIGYESSAVGVVTMDDGSYLTNPDIYVGYNGNGMLSITGSRAFGGDYGYIGYGPGSTGVVNVDRAEWDCLFGLIIGREGTGVLNITNGGRVSNGYSSIGEFSSSMGVVTVTGNGSNWTSGSLDVGERGTGVLNITNGGAVNSDSGSIGEEPGSTGVVTVTGPGSTWTTIGAIRVGDGGDGVLNISNGGSVSNDFGGIGSNSGSTGLVTVDGAGSTWTNSSGLYVAWSGNGTLDITNGGVVNSPLWNHIGYEVNSTGVVTVDGPGSKLACGLLLEVGPKGSGTLNITNGGTVSVAASVSMGGESGSEGVVMVDGPGSTWTIGSGLDVGHYGNGLLNISNHGKVSVARFGIGANGVINLNGGILELTDYMNFYDWDGAFNFTSGEIRVNNGTVVPQAATTINTNQVLTVTGSSSSWGNTSYGMLIDDGDLHIYDGGVVSNGDAHIGQNSNSTGVVTVDGAGSTWASSGSISVGSHGSGELNITGSGVVSNSYGSVIGGYSESIGVVTVDGPGSTWTNSGNLIIGSHGRGTMNITNGGVVSSGYGSIGSNLDSTGVVTVDGGGSKWMNSGLGVGGSGNGVLNITGGGAVSSDFGSIGNYPDSTGRVTVDGTGSTWTNSDDLVVGYYGRGTLNITNGGVVSNENHSLIGFTFNLSSEVTVDGTGSTWRNNRSLLVGHEGNAVLNITNGGLVSVAEALIIDGTSNGNSFVNMASGGMLALYGEGDYDIDVFFELLTSDAGTDAIRYWDYALGDWTDIAGATLGEDFVLDYITTPGDELLGYTMLTVLEQALLIGDANRDGVISASDYAAVQANFGNTGIAGIHGDANGDGVVSASDYASVQANYGNVAAGGETSITPEPATLSLLALGGVMVTIRRKRK